MQKRMTLEAEHGPMETAASGEEIKRRTRALAASLLGCDPDEIAFAPSGAVAWGLPVSAMPAFRPGDRILVSRQEWGGNVSTLYMIGQRTGATIEVMPVRDDGIVDLDRLSAMIDDRVRLICLTWLPCNGGLIDDAEGIGRIAKAHDIPYVIDAAQAVGQIPVDVGRIGCDVLATTARKHIRGPRGTALLYVRGGFQSKLTPPWGDTKSVPFMGDAPNPVKTAQLFESSEMSAVLLAGLDAALSLTNEIGVDVIRARVARGADRLRQILQDIPGLCLMDRGTELSGLVSFQLEGTSARELQAALADRGIAIGSNGRLYTPYDMAARGIDQIARATVSYLTADEEIDALCRAIENIAAG